MHVIATNIYIHFNKESNEYDSQLYETKFLVTVDTLLLYRQCNVRFFFSNMKL